VHRDVLLDPANLNETAAAVLDAWRSSLVVVMRAAGAVPDVRATYHELLPLIGRPHHLAEDVRIGSRDQQRTGELWFEVRYDPAFPDAYRHSQNAQPLHTDGSYIPAFPNASLLCCVANADEGGETIFVSAERIVEALEADEPELLHALMTTPVPHQRSGDRRVHTIIRREEDGLHLNYNYYCVAKDCDAAAASLNERFFAFLRDSPRLREAVTTVKLRPGDAVVWKDERVLHGRNAFVPNAPSARFLWKCAIDVGVLGS
jgi:alpha-ketoglutarate-dependent taurine dioxygenase